MGADALSAGALFPLPSGKCPAHQCSEMVRTATGPSEAHIHFLFSNQKTGESNHAIHIGRSLMDFNTVSTHLSSSPKAKTLRQAS